jgi:hypothetical protein
MPAILGRARRSLPTGPILLCLEQDLLTGQVQGLAGLLLGHRSTTEPAARPSGSTCPSQWSSS